MERSALQLIRLHSNQELKDSLEFLSEDFVSLDLLVHSLAYPDYDIIILEIQRQLTALQKWYRFKGAPLIVLHEENLKIIEQIRKNKKG